MEYGQPAPRKFTPLVLLIVGLVMMAVGSYLVYHKYEFKKNGLRAEGVVVELIESFDHDAGEVSRRVTYTPVFRFKAASGDSVTAKYGMGSNPPEYDKGEHVTLFYFADNPQVVQTDFNSIEELIFGVLIGGGLVAAGIGVFKMIQARKTV